MTYRHHPIVWFAINSFIKSSISTSVPVSRLLSLAWNTTFSIDFTFDFQVPTGTPKFLSESLCLKHGIHHIITYIYHNYGTGITISSRLRL